MQSLAYTFSNMSYHTFGMLMPGRKYATATYRFGFNGKENVNEIDGAGNSIDFGARVHDSRVTRFFSIDPEYKKNCNTSVYSYAYNNPILFVDNEGKDGRIAVDLATHTINISSTIFIYGDNYTEKRVQEVQEAFNKLNTTALVTDPKTNEVWTVKFNVTYKYVNEAAGKLIDGNLQNKDCADRSAPGNVDARKLDNATKESIGFTEGDNILKYNDGKFDNSKCGETQYQGSNFGNLYCITTCAAIHESFHQLGFDERYCGMVSYSQFRGDVLDQEGCAARINEVHFLDAQQFALDNCSTQESVGYHCNPTECSMDYTDHGCDMNAQQIETAKDCVQTK
jgi:RHS repeat-associated protein